MNKLKSKTNSKIAYQYWCPQAGKTIIVRKNAPDKIDEGQVFIDQTNAFYSAPPVREKRVKRKTK